MSDEIPQWAKVRACELANDEAGCEYWRHDECDSYATLAALARYIAQHEQPPVDPDLVTAREICARVAREVASGMPDFQANYRDGLYDDEPEVQFALSALEAARNG